MTLRAYSSFLRENLYPSRGIQRAHFMEMHLINRCSVNTAFCSRYYLIYVSDVIFHILRNLKIFDNSLDIIQRIVCMLPMIMVMFVVVVMFMMTMVMVVIVMMTMLNMISGH